MAYYLANLKVLEIGKSVFGNDLQNMAFTYNKKYKYWYRVTKNDIIQFLGMSRYSGGMYDLSFLCQPLFASVWTGAIEDKRGVAPNFESRLGTDVLSHMIELGLFPGENVPKLKGMASNDSIDLIKRHMRITFDNVVKPVFEKSQDVSSCYQEHKRLQEIQLKIIRQHNYEYWRAYRYMTSELEIYSLLYLHEYEKAINIINKDSMMRRKEKSACIYERLLPMIQKRDEALIMQYLEDCRAKTIAELRNYEFNI